MGVETILDPPAGLAPLIDDPLRGGVETTMRLESFLQIIVPLTFLAIWALTSLFNREAQPLPPRSNRMPPNGPPGAKPPGQRPAERRPDPVLRDPASRWQASSPQTRPNTKRPGGMNDADIVILETEIRRTPTPPPPRPGAGMSPKRGSRPRGATAPIPPTKRSPEPPPPRALSASMAQENSSISRAVEVSPLGRLKSSLSVPEAHDLTKVEKTEGIKSVQSILAGEEGSSQPISLNKLREAIILNELLAPPLALRQRPSRTRPL